MSRILLCGWEYNSTVELGTIANNGMGFSVTNARARSGTYSYRITSSGAGGAGYYSYISTPFGANKTEIYGRIGVSPAWDTGEALFLFKLVDDTPATQCSLLLNTTDGLLRAYRGDASLLLGTSNQAIINNAWNCIEFHVSIADAGVFQVWLNGTLVLDASGDTQQTAKAYITSIYMGFMRSGAGSATSAYYFDDFAINDTSDPGGDDAGLQMGRCGGGGLLLQKPNGNGTYSQLTGSDGNKVDNYLLEDEIPPNTTDYVQSAVVDEQDTYLMEDIPAVYNRVVLVQPIFYAALSAAGTGGIRSVIRSAGADDVDAADRLLSTSWGYVRGEVRCNDPNAGSPIPWTSASVNAIEVGPRVR